MTEERGVGLFGGCNDIIWIILIIVIICCCCPGIFGGLGGYCKG